MSKIISKSEFYNAAMQELSTLPALAARVSVGDVTITQQFGAMAQMLAMLSYQIGLAETEVWEKTRDSMVLADAAIKGILPMASAAKYTAVAVNNSGYWANISSGRRLLDNQGRVWRVVDGAEVAAGESAGIKIEQVDSRNSLHFVSEVKNFYRIPIPKPDDNSFVSGIYVKDSAGELFKMSNEFTNVQAGEKVYQVIVDDHMDMYIQFGVEGVAGYVPSISDSFDLTIEYTNGDATLEYETELTFEYKTYDDEGVAILSNGIINGGVPPMSIDELRELAKYPFIYDHNAVFLGEFEFLIFKKINGFKFLSVWNEQKEEAVRGANLNNINTLNVAFINSIYADHEVKDKIRKIIARADDSYKVRFFDVVEREIPLTVKLRLANIYDEADIKRQVISWLVTRYGYNSAFSKLGSKRINWQQALKGLKEEIYQLNDGVSDISIFADEQDEVTNPEVYSFISEDSIKISNQPLDAFHSYG